VIPKPYIAKWQEHAPWKQFSQVEQDLVISRVLVEIFSDDFLRENLEILHQDILKILIWYKLKQVQLNQ